MQCILNLRQKKAHKKLWANLNIKFIEGSLFTRERSKKHVREKICLYKPYIEKISIRKFSVNDVSMGKSKPS